MNFRSSLADICGALDYAIRSGSTLEELLLLTVNRAARLWDGQVCDILLSNLERLDIGIGFAPEVLALDEALAVMEESDKHAALEEKRAAPSHLQEHQGCKRTISNARRLSWARSRDRRLQAGKVTNTV